MLSGRMAIQSFSPFAGDEKTDEAHHFYDQRISASEEKSSSSGIQGPQQDGLDSSIFRCNGATFEENTSIEIHLRQLSRRRSFCNLNSVNVEKLQMSKLSSRDDSIDAYFSEQSNSLRASQVPRFMQLRSRGYKKDIDLPKVVPSLIKSKSCLKVKTFEESLSSSLQSSHIGSSPKTCRFSTTEIRLHPMILGDNPSVSDGPPITIDWNIIKSKTIPVQEFERLVSKSRKKRGFARNIVSPYSRKQRENILRNSGYSVSDIEACIHSIAKVKKDRSVTNSNIAYKLEEGAESACRKFKRWVFKKPRDRILYDRWVQEHQVNFDHTTTEAVDCTKKSGITRTRKSAAALSA